MSKANVLAIDCSNAGVAGDMLFSALFSLVKEDQDSLSLELSNLLSSIVGETVEFQTSVVSYHGQTGLRLVEIEPNIEMTWNEIDSAIRNASQRLSGVYSQALTKSWELITDAEKQIHGTDSIVLHELGHFDTVFDLVSVFYILEKLKVSEVILSPVATGTGMARTSHGMVPIPVPAVQYILEKTQIPTVHSQLPYELLTPTGAALLGSIKSLFPSPKHAIWERSTLGFGLMQLEGTVNAVRVRLGHTPTSPSSITILETNIDDVSGEILGDAVERLMEKGALDVSYSPLIMKKNRPGWLLRVICVSEAADPLIEYIQRLTGTLGVRVMPIERHVGSRSFEERELNIGERMVSFTIKKGKFGQKVEFEDLKRLANELDLTPKEVLDLIQSHLQDP